MIRKTMTASLLLITTFALVSFAQISEPEVRLVKIAEIEGRTPADGIVARRVVGKTVWVGVVELEQGAKSNHHNHPDEQLVFVEAGRVRAYVGDDEYTMGPGEAIVIPSYVPHQFEALEPARWKEIHGPGFGT